MVRKVNRHIHFDLPVFVLNSAPPPIEGLEFLHWDENDYISHILYIIWRLATDTFRACNLASDLHMELPERIMYLPKEPLAVSEFERYRIFRNGYLWKFSLIDDCVSGYLGYYR